MAGYNYTTYVAEVASLIEAQISTALAGSATPFLDNNYNNHLPRAIEYAEQRIYRELDLMGTRLIDNTGQLTPNSRIFVLPTDLNNFIVTEEISVLPTAGVRQLLLPVTKQFIDAAWPNDAAPGAPSLPIYWCPFDQASILVAPSPDINYSIEVTGTVRPATLSSSNTTTILTTYLPDLFLAGSMISWFSFQRDLGAVSDDPKATVTWESQYEALVKSAAVEQFRVRFQSQGWSSKLPSPVASPQT